MSFIDQPIEFYLLGNPRSIKDISGYITISENTTDTLEITQHPVQQGATITDHSFLNPTTFSAQLQFAPSLFSSLKTKYQELLDLQASREPFDIVTPKRIYKDMLFQSLALTTDKKTENILSVNAAFKQVILVPIVTMYLDPATLKKRADTQATQNVGKKSIAKTAATGIAQFFNGGG